MTLRDIVYTGLIAFTFAGMIWFNISRDSKAYMQREAIHAYTTDALQGSVQAVHDIGTVLDNAEDGSKWAGVKLAGREGLEKIITYSASDVTKTEAILEAAKQINYGTPYSHVKKVLRGHVKLLTGNDETEKRRSLAALESYSIGIQNINDADLENEVSALKKAVIPCQDTQEVQSFLRDLH
jgi:hypothetical protein